MISQIEALNYRCLRYVKQPLGGFHVLVGPNASGKTTFLDVVAFLGDLVSEGLDDALTRRSRNFSDFVFGRQGNRFELSIEASIPERIRPTLAKQQDFETIRYEIAVGVDPASEEVVLLAETVKLKVWQAAPPRQRELFPEPLVPPETILSGTQRGSRRIVNKVPHGNDNFYSEVHGESGKGWAPAFKLGPRKSALGNLPEDESKFPASTWLKRLLAAGVQRFVLDSLAMRNASPPGQARTFKTDGSNLPWVIEHLRDQSPQRFNKWVGHIQTALPDIAGIRTIERADDKHRYLVIQYQGGLEVPSWMASDGTLRLLALTLPAYLADFSGIYLIEEPENGIHPRAVETVFQSLSSVYDAQILLATHSPVILSLVRPDQLLCFAKSDAGATDITLGSEHPALEEWKGGADLSTLFAAGVLG